MSDIKYNPKGLAEIGEKFNKMTSVASSDYSVFHKYATGLLTEENASVSAVVKNSRDEFLANSTTINTKIEELLSLDGKFKNVFNELAEVFGAKERL